MEVNKTNLKQVLISGAVLMLLSFIGTMMLVARFLITGQLEHYYLVWNLFLAWIPFILAMIIEYKFGGKSIIQKGNRLGATLLGLLWLFFYPNAPYMITDFIHIRRGATLLVWYDFVIFALFIITAFIIGFISLYIVHRVVAKSFKSNAMGWLFAIAIQILSGFGIYLGRITRWNSWDIIFSPIVILNSVLDNLHYRPLIFSLLFGMFLTLTYMAMYSLTVLNQGRAEEK